MNFVCMFQITPSKICICAVNGGVNSNINTVITVILFTFFALLAKSVCTVWYIYCCSL